MDGEHLARRWWWVGVVIVTLACAGVAGAVTVAGPSAPDAGNAAVASLSAEALASLTTVAPAATTTTVQAPPRPTTTVPAKALQPTSAAGITVEVTPSRPKAGETVRFVVTATQPGNCCSIGLQPGDGGQPALAPGSQNCTASPAGKQRVEFTYVYNRPGTWNAVARSDAGRACDLDDQMRAAFPGGHWNGTIMPPVTTPALPQIQTTVSVVVTAGVTSSQGPESPQIEAHLAAEPGGHVMLSGVVFDRDGWVQRVTIDWGDGSPAVVLSPASACRAADSGWPVGSPMLIQALPPGMPTPSVAPPTHAYTAPGTYAVVVTTVSSGCDGASQQRTTRTLHWVR